MHYASRLFHTPFLASLLIALPLEIDRGEFAAFAKYPRMRD
jgi:hypothetical protein